MSIVLMLACSTCRITMAEGGGDAAGWSIFFLLIVILGVLGGLGAFMIHLARLSKRHHDPSLSDDVRDVESSL